MFNTLLDSSKRSGDNKQLRLIHDESRWATLLMRCYMHISSRSQEIPYSIVETVYRFKMDHQLLDFRELVLSHYPLRTYMTI